MKVSDFDYYLPDELIAQEPLPHRDESRLMLVRRDSESFEHKMFRDVKQLLRAGDVLVLNDTRVLPARLFAVREDTGGRVEVLLVRETGDRLWEVLVKPGRRARPGAVLIFGGGLLKGAIVGCTETGERLIRFESSVPFREALDKIGIMPLPPYIKKYPRDPGRYQTVYARKEGSVAAPTAGLHFTGKLLDEIKEMGVEVVTVLLHVGPGTFRPVKTENVTDHRMHEEYFEISVRAAEIINEAVQDPDRRVIAVGTTTVRCLESGSGNQGRVRPGSGYTGIFIYPGYRFKVIDGLITNFHLPRSTLIMMVSALAGREKIMRAYREAVERRYRFFSFGDAMIIL
ncbi:MAG: tRNA preQ1(34) S-adenosylmethionine ribosyltransferase-isomerase QueA [Bacillota bacterium]